MKKGLLICCFFLITIKGFSQRFSQYNTGTLYDSFENPAQRSFIPDTTRQFAFNFFLPTISTQFYVTGNGQEALKTRAFSNYYNTANLKTGGGAFNRINLSSNAYTVMFKVFTSEHGDQEIGFSFNTKAEARVVGTDESISLFNSFTNFPANSYTNIFNDSFFAQAYHEASFTYREQVTKRLSVGVKLSALSGLYYRKSDITQSGITFDRTADQATIQLTGTDRQNETKGLSNAQKYLPAFLNPGAAISLGTAYNDESGYKWQVNVKDLGFIHWRSSSTISTFGGSALITDFSKSTREKTITTTVDSISSTGTVRKGFNSPINGTLELSINRTYWLDDDQKLKFSPTLIGSKEFFYSGFTAALVTPIQYNKYSVTLTSTYNDLKLFALGGQFMVKATNSEFFIGSDRLYQTGYLIGDALHRKADNSQTQAVVNQGAYSGMDFFIGVSFKFGYLIERRLNSSSIPMDDERGFFGKAWYNLFHKKDQNY
jgi:hypothetical protein